MYTNYKNKELLIFGFFIILTFFSNSKSFAQQTSEKFALEIEYLLSLPDEYETDTAKKWPLLVFLHGSGERGHDLDSLLKHGPPMHVNQGKRYPFILVSPQCKPNTGWSTELLQAMLEKIIADKRVDTNRIYLTGLSMGGYGTWEWAMERPDMFAAIAPICGGGSTTDIWKLRHTPTWNFHGALDPVVPISQSQVMVDSLRKYNDDVQFTIYPEEYHESWVPAYKNDKLYEWFLSKRKFSFKPKQVKEEILNEYVSEYKAVNGAQVIAISTEEGKLMGSFNGQKHELKPSSETAFFLDTSSITEIVFEKDDKGEVHQLVMYDNELMVFKRK